MKPTILYALEVLVCSGVLLACYSILLERRVRFRWCRLYLLIFPAAAALIPLLRIPVWPAREQAAYVAVQLTGAWQGEIVPDTAEPLITAENLCLGFYLLGVAIVAGVMLWQTVRMRRLRREGEITRTGHYKLVRTTQEIASFSFFSTIYVWNQTPPEEMEAIVAHESSHIAHRHSAERIVMESVKALMWWNPFVWIAARRLIEAEEFEADSDVLAGGYDRATYMHTIFKQLFGYAPEIANGLRNSLTKKRFKMMTTQTKSRYGLLRLAGTLPAVIGLLCAFAFTTRAAQPAPTPVSGSDSVAMATVDIHVAKDRKPLPGALVVCVADKKYGAVTDTEGHAKITVPQGSVLEISYAGCKPQLYQLPAGKEKTMLLMHMEPATTAAADDSRPLYLVDGLEMESIRNLESSRIKSITVLKDKQTLAKYGDRARNGVVLVELKNGSDIPPATPERNGIAETVSMTDGKISAETANNTTTEAEFDNGSIRETAGADDAEEPFLIAETMPAFQGGNLLDFRAWVQANVLYPAEAINANIQGRVVLSFVVEKDGSVSNIQILQTPDQLLTDAAKNAIAASPRWEPGKQKDKEVRVRYTLPVDFKIAPKQEAAPDEPDGTDAPAVADNAAETEDNELYLIAETMPTFQGGDLTNFRRWVQQNVRYPEKAKKAKLTGRVVVSFTVEKDGSVTADKIMATPGKSLSEEVLRVLSSSPKWEPGTQRGKIVRVRYVLPIEFALQSDGKKLEFSKESDPKGSMERINVVGYDD